MKAWMTMTGALGLAALLLPGNGLAETLRSETFEADLARRVVTMKARDGKAIQGEQVHVTLRRRDGRPIGAQDLREHVSFAERAACQGRQVLVSLMVGADGGAGRYEVLCARGN